MKLVGLALIAAAGVFLGVMASQNLRRRALALEQMEKLIVRLSTQIKYTAAPVQELLPAAMKSGEYEALRFLGPLREGLAQESDFPRLWEAAVAGRGGDCGFTLQDKALLCEFGRGLGVSDLEGTQSHCGLYRDLFHKQAEAARQDVSSKGRLYITLGIAGGLGLALLLL